MIKESRILKIGLCGASGKMGQAIIQKVNFSANKFEIVAIFNSKDDLIKLDNLCEQAEVIIDFSSPEILPSVIDRCTLYNKNLIIGTTGLSQNHIQKIAEASKKIAIVHSANMSVGINAILAFIASLSIANDSNYDADIIDYHHRLKKDSPSGTALMVGEAIASLRGYDLEKCSVLDSYSAGPRKDEQIRFASIRAGGIYGEHDIIFASKDEVITIKHQALNRGLFADGALKAAAWVISKPAGLYSMQDVVAPSVHT